jgi:hypothetical protein
MREEAPELRPTPTIEAVERERKPQPRWGWRYPTQSTQGSSLLATPGWRTQSLRDWGRSRGFVGNARGEQEGERTPQHSDTLCAPEPPAGPLTPALSPSEGERKNRRQLSGEARFMGRVAARRVRGSANGIMAFPSRDLRYSGAHAGTGTTG